MFGHTWHFLLVALAGFINRHQQDIIAHLQEENRVLREKLGNKRILLNDAQKRRLAIAAAKLGMKVLQECVTLFSPETLLRWHRKLVARKYDGSGKRGPKPEKAASIRDLVLQMKEENPEWGYGHIHGELKGLGYDVSWQTVRRIMIEHGLMDDPKHTKKMNWLTFIKAHIESMSACDFFSVEAWTPKGLTRFMVYIVIDVSTRKVHIAGIDEAPDEQWMLQMARNLTDPEHGFLKNKRFMIHDRDPLFTVKFRKTLKAMGVRTLKMPKQSANLNAFSERFVQTIKTECTDKMIFFGEKHLRHVIAEFMEHYHEERPHQGLDLLPPAARWAAENLLPQSGVDHPHDCLTPGEARSGHAMGAGTPRLHSARPRGLRSFRPSGRPPITPLWPSRPAYIDPLFACGRDRVNVR